MLYDDPKNKWLQDRQVLLNVMAGDGTAVKTFGTTTQVDVPRHVIFTCQEKPEHLPEEYKDRLRPVQILPHRRYGNPDLCDYNYQRVYEFTKKLRPYLERDEVPCYCLLRNDIPCHVRRKDEDPKKCNNASFNSLLV